MRLDKWLWAARFFKTRSLAQQAIESGRVKLNDQRIKPAHVLKISDLVLVRVGELDWHVRVKELSEKRGPAQQARKLYEETAESRAERERRIELRRWSAEPAAQIKGRPTKRDRRRLEDLTSPPDESERSR
jgi:ribosome-associated heat shock protein Hsp15